MSITVRAVAYIVFALGLLIFLVLLALLPVYGAHTISLPMSICSLVISTSSFAIVLLNIQEHKK